MVTSKNLQYRKISNPVTYSPVAHNTSRCFSRYPDYDPNTATENGLTHVNQILKHSNSNTVEPNSLTDGQLFPIRHKHTRSQPQASDKHYASFNILNPSASYSIDEQGQSVNRFYPISTTASSKSNPKCQFSSFAPYGKFSGVGYPTQSHTYYDIRRPYHTNKNNVRLPKSKSQQLDRGSLQKQGEQFGKSKMEPGSVKFADLNVSLSDETLNEVSNIVSASGTNELICESTEKAPSSPTDEVANASTDQAHAPVSSSRYISDAYREASFV